MYCFRGSRYREDLLTTPWLAQVKVATSFGTPLIQIKQIHHTIMLIIFFNLRPSPSNYLFQKSHDQNFACMSYFSQVYYVFPFSDLSLTIVRAGSFCIRSGNVSSDSELVSRLGDEYQFTSRRVADRKKRVSGLLTWSLLSRTLQPLWSHESGFMGLHYYIDWIDCLLHAVSLSVLQSALHVMTSSCVLTKSNFATSWYRIFFVNLQLFYGSVNSLFTTVITKDSIVHYFKTCR